MYGGMIDQFLENLSRVEEYTYVNEKKKALKVANELVGPIHQFGDSQLRNLVILLIGYIDRDEKESILLTIREIKNKVSKKRVAAV